MLAVKRSAGVAPMMNHEDSLGNKAHKWSVHALALKYRGRHNQKSKTGVLLAIQKEKKKDSYYKIKI